MEHTNAPLGAPVHRPNGWLLAIGIKRCALRNCREEWPCPGQMRRLVDPRDVVKERAAIAWQAKVLGAIHGTRPAATP